MRQTSAITGLAAVLVLAACASVPPPTDTIAAANLALGKAEQAERAVEREENLEARRLAETALVDAQLAEARSDAARAQRNVAEIRTNVEALQSETERALER